MGWHDVRAQQVFECCHPRGLWLLDIAPAAGNGCRFLTVYCLLSAALRVWLQVVKVDCDVHKDLMNHYRARGLPLMAVFNGGEVCSEKMLDFPARRVKPSGTGKPNITPSNCRHGFVTVESFQVTLLESAKIATNLMNRKLQAAMFPEN